MNQTHHDIEVIVVNDGSTDNGMEIVQKFIDKYTNPKEEIGNVIRVNGFSKNNAVLHTTNKYLNFEIDNSPLRKFKIINQNNSGVSTARNTGINHAFYDYIAFLDADDWWEPTYLSEMSNLINEFPDAGIYCSSYFVVKNGQKKRANIGVESSFNRGTINYFQVYANTLCMPVWTGSTIIPKEILKIEKGFKSKLKLGEDFDLWVRIALEYKIAYINKPLSNYFQDADIKYRAIGKLYSPECHILWNLDYLLVEESNNADLKQLLDNLRVYGLYPYFLNNKYRELARTELKKVDWTKQNGTKINQYSTNIVIAKFIYLAKKSVYRIKTFLIQIYQYQKIHSK